MSSDAQSEELAYLRTVFDALPDVIVLFRYDAEEAEAICVWCNNAALLATGLTRDEIIGFPPRRLLAIPGDFERAETRRTLFDALGSAGILEIEYPMADPSMPEGTLLRIRIYPTKPGSDLYVLQTERVGQRQVIRLK